MGLRGGIAGTGGRKGKEGDCKMKWWVMNENIWWSSISVELIDAYNYLLLLY